MICKLREGCKQFTPAPPQPWEKISIMCAHSEKCPTYTPYTVEDLNLKPSDGFVVLFPEAEQ